MKALLIGAAVALAAGLTMGAALHPNLRSDDCPEGPQMFALAGGSRPILPFDSGMSLASYGRAVPDYVIGTDANKALAWPQERAAVGEARDVAGAEPQDPDLVRADYDDEPAVSQPADDPHSKADAQAASVADDDAAMPIVTG